MAGKETTAFEYPRAWFEFSFSNQDKVTGNHTALYLWIVQLNNMLGWIKIFACPTSQSMNATGIGSPKTHKKIFMDLVEWGKITLIKDSPNQHQAVIICLGKIAKADTQALTTAVLNQIPEQYPSTDPINKPQTTNHKPQTKEDKPQLNFLFSSDEFKSVWAEWLEYKAKQHRFKFKTIKSQQQSLKLLFRESHESEAIAISMLEYAMAKGWIGWVMKEDKNFYVTRKKESNDQNDMVF